MSPNNTLRSPQQEFQRFGQADFWKDSGPFPAAGFAVSPDEGSFKETYHLSKTSHLGKSPAG